MSNAYAQAGVSIDEANELVSKIKPLAKATTRAGVLGGLGGFGALFDLKAAGFNDPLLVSSTDGVGTKLKLAFATGQHDTVGIDLVAMCVNDLLVQGATPLFVLDYFATGVLEADAAASVIGGIAEGCKQSDCALIGGETAEMPGMYQKGEYDLAGFVVGAVERDRLITGEHIKAGDVVLGLASSGVHSNGFSLVRKIVDASGVALSDPAPFDASKTLGESLMTPTRIYVKQILSLLKSDVGASVKGMAHITGGGLLENIPRVLPEGLGVALKKDAWQSLPVFDWLQEQGKLSFEDMVLTFNCGVGMVLIVDADKAAAITSQLQASGETVYALGQVCEAASTRVTFA